MQDQLKLLQVDDQDVDRIIIRFAGQIELDVRDKDARAMFDALRLGKIADFRVSGPCAQKVQRRKEATETAAAQVDSVAVIAVDSILGIGGE